MKGLRDRPVCLSVGTLVFPRPGENIKSALSWKADTGVVPEQDAGRVEQRLQCARRDRCERHGSRNAMRIIAAVMRSNLLLTLGALPDVGAEAIDDKPPTVGDLADLSVIKGSRPSLAARHDGQR